MFYIVPVWKRPRFSPLWPGTRQPGSLNNTRLTLYANPGTTRDNRELTLNEWYRAEIKERIPDLLAKWEPIIGEDVAEWGVKKMKTKWGSCNMGDGRIWLNLELAKKPP
ncbi:MAG: M48 family metallopeptidase [Anaerolineae bacterium]|nr:M48 family metallopeptidase [Anaerolineae bacterium]